MRSRLKENSAGKDKTPLYKTDVKKTVLISKFHFSKLSCASAEAIIPPFLPLLMMRLHLMGNYCHVPLQR